MSVLDGVRASLNTYLEHFPEDATHLKLLREQLKDDEEMFRKNFRGHLTGAGVVLNSDHTAVLLVHHRALDRWLQPGGHLEPGDANLLATARREVTEETGLTDLEQIAILGDPLVPIYVETHYIPLRPEKNEPEHYHHDFRYAFVARSTDLTGQVEEVRDVVWAALDDKRIPPELQQTINRIISVAA